jgi:hypothetical protein
VQSIAVTSGSLEGEHKPAGSLACQWFLPSQARLAPAQRPPEPVRRPNAINAAGRIFIKCAGLPRQEFNQEFTILLKGANGS